MLITLSHKKSLYKLFVFIVCIAFSLFLFKLPLFSQQNRYEGKTISSITFEGLSYTKASTLKSSLTLRVQETFSLEKANRDLKKIYSSGYIKISLYALELIKRIRCMLFIRSKKTLLLIK